MEIIESNYTEYLSVFSLPYHIFNSAGFNELNKEKCEELKFLLFKDSKYRLGFIGGVRDGYLISPFSAPFGGLSFLKADVQITAIESALDLLENYVLGKGLKGIKISLPPLIYNETFLTKTINVLYRRSYYLQNLDLDFYIDLRIVDNYADNIWYNAKKNMKISLKQDFVFTKCDLTQIEEIYDIIKQNREFKGKPLNMSLQNIINTTSVINTDFFMVTKDGVGYASAIIFHANEEIIYVPLWADKPGFGHLKPMNFLTHKILEYYNSKGKKYIHIGISTEESVPNYGLCEFKESIGSTLTPKFTYTKHF